MKNISIHLLFSFLVLSAPAFAQYSGGPGDGSASAVSSSEPAGFEGGAPAQSTGGPVMTDVSPVPDGLQKEYYDNGKIKSVIPYVNGKKEGTAKFYSRQGKLTKEIYYRNDAIMGMKGFQKRTSKKWPLLFDLISSVDFKSLQDKIQNAPETIKTAAPYVRVAVLLSFIAAVLILGGMFCLAFLRTDASAKTNIVGWICIFYSPPGFLMYPLAAETAKYQGLVGIFASTLMLFSGIGILLRSRVARTTALTVMIVLCSAASIYFLISFAGFIVAMIQYSTDLAADSRILMVVSSIGMIAFGVIWRSLKAPDIAGQFHKIHEGPKDSQMPQPAPPEGKRL